MKPLPPPPPIAQLTNGAGPYRDLIDRIIIAVDRKVALHETPLDRVRERDSDSLLLYLDDGSAYELWLTGDCCSISEFTPEAFEAAQELIGAKVLNVDERYGGDTNAFVCNCGVPEHEGAGMHSTACNVFKAGPRVEALIERHPSTDCDTWHFLVFTTDKGHVTLDWRNRSNGYYDGAIEFGRAPRLPIPAHDAALEGNVRAALAIRDAVLREPVQKLIDEADAHVRGVKTEENCG